MMQTPGIALAIAEFSGLAAAGCLVASCCSLRSPIHAALMHMTRFFQSPRIYVIGGAQNNQALDTVECYDPEACQWSQLPPMPTPRSDLAATVIGGKLYVMGGYDGLLVSKNFHLHTSKFA